jgi:hypothetical protein
MKKLSDYLGEELTFRQTSIFKREFELFSANELLAKMSFPKFFSSTALIEGLEEKYEIKVLSFWRTDIGIFKQGYQMPFAKYSQLNFLGFKGMIELPRGEKLILKFGSFKKSCQILNSSEELLITIRNKISFKEKNSVVIEKRSEVMDQNSWIIFMAYFKILQQTKNTGVV